ncbi:hypothetical protein [Pseudomonas fragi]|uniref:hypothetical protein n=1 Tax=Pseudomonas fragi TaxID=296 RepID=UPI001CB70EB3|nr:hypothetical protein [Pseudomonas fragi]
MLVNRVLGDCPRCKAQQCFGNVSVRRDHVLRGCRYCKYHSEIWLPEIRKKVVYLDQFFFSAAFRGEDPRFVEAAERVKQAAHLQLLVAPYSSIHEDETHQWRGHKGFTKADLMEFIKAAARGVEFQRDYEVESVQITKAWSAFLKGGPTQYIFEDHDAIEGDLAEWDDYYRIDVSGYFKDIEMVRSLKGEAVDALLNVFDNWRKSTQTFEQDVALDMLTAGNNYLNTYITMAVRLAKGDFDALLDSPMVTKVVESMLRWLPDDHPLEQRLQRCADFFGSEHFNQVPNLHISSRMFATLKSMVRRGAYSNRKEARRRLNGVFEDIRHISLYAPYCDAFFMDQPMAEIARQPGVDLENRYSVRIFSLNNLTEFYEWIDSLVAGMTDEHRAGVESAYPR